MKRMQIEEGEHNQWNGLLTFLFGLVRFFLSFFLSFFLFCCCCWFPRFSFSISGAATTACDLSASRPGTSAIPGPSIFWSILDGMPRPRPSWSGFNSSRLSPTVSQQPTDLALLFFGSSLFFFVVVPFIFFFLLRISFDILVLSFSFFLSLSLSRSYDCKRQNGCPL